MNLPALRIESGFWYLATPYTKYPLGLDAAWRAACMAAGNLVKLGVPVFSPIAHSHPIAEISDIKKKDHGIWLPVARPMMDAAFGMLILTLPTWQTSFGINEEIKIFDAACKPIEEIDPSELMYEALSC